MLNRIVLLVSLIGMVITLHLWVQKERNFDQGCWGVGGSAAVAAAEGCRDPALQKAGMLFGISAAAWGYAFFFTTAVLAFAKSIAPARIAERCHAVSEVVVAAACPYSLYLVYYQAFVAKAYCPLCLVTTGLVTTLFAIHVYQYLRQGFTPVADSDRITEIGYASGMVFAATGVLVALLLFVDQVGTRRLDHAANLRQFEAMVGRSLPAHIDSEWLKSMRPTRTDKTMPGLKTEEWVNAGFPSLGTKDGVSLVAFFDPNCPHCDGTYATIVKTAERVKDRATVYVFPRVLWDYSLLQVQALELAREQGKYFEMWSLQFERRKKGGLALKDLEKLFQDLGLDTKDLEKRLAAVRPAVIAMREKARAAGVNSTPAIFVDGAGVAGPSRTEEGLSKLVDQAIAARKTPAAAPAAEAVKTEGAVKTAAVAAPGEKAVPAP